MLENFMQFIIIPICIIYFEQVYWELIPLVSPSWIAIFEMLMARASEGQAEVGNFHPLPKG